MPTTDKTTIRQHLLRQRSVLNLGHKQILSNKICQHILELDTYQKAQTLALYQPIKNEVDLNFVWQTSCQNAKSCYFPSVHQDKTLTFNLGTLKSQWRKNQFGIDEPLTNSQKPIPVNEIDILFVPLVGFDTDGNRIGMGAGYYDRTLSIKKPQLLAGVGYEFQKLPSIKPNIWDIPLDLIITEKKIYWRNHV